MALILFACLPTWCRIIALGPGGAGFVEWVWNSNCYMPSDNEAAIGLWRADGTAKPELEALRGVAAFAAQARRHLVGRQAEPVLLVVPHSNMFSTRNTATDATKRAVRAMQYGCRMGLWAISEFAATPAMHVPRLVLVPSPRELCEQAWNAIRAWARRGSVVLVTGPLGALEQLGTGQPVGPSAAVRVPIGRGEILWSPLSVELAGDDGATVELYRWALGRARLVPAFHGRRGRRLGPGPRGDLPRRGALYAGFGSLAVFAGATALWRPRFRCGAARRAGRAPPGCPVGRPAPRALPAVLTLSVAAPGGGERPSRRRWRSRPMASAGGPGWRRRPAWAACPSPRPQRG